jgi:prepilin-type N-terminal cleavage/methylation domain-containing protein
MCFSGALRRGTSLVESLVALAILGIVLSVGAGFFARQRDLSRDRLDREKALRALATEWVFLRTAPKGELIPREASPFVGPGDWVDSLDARKPSLRIRPTAYADLHAVRLEIGFGVRGGRRIVQEGWVFAGEGR